VAHRAFDWFHFSAVAADCTPSCGPNAGCQGSGESPVCVCTPGFEGDGYNCSGWFYNELLLGEFLKKTHLFKHEGSKIISSFFSLLHLMQTSMSARRLSYTTVTSTPCVQTLKDCTSAAV